MISSLQRLMETSFKVASHLTSWIDRKVSFRGEFLAGAVCSFEANLSMINCRKVVVKIVSHFSMFLGNK